MAAIAGVVYPKILPGTRAIEGALRALESRSAAEPETYLHKNVEIGARGEALAFNERHTLVAAVDGQLYETEELCLKLKRAGCPIEGASVAQLVLHAYDVWDLDFVDHLHGAFAIALFDLAKGELILARDRLGIKPLFWSFHRGTLLFASQLKAILATGLVPQSAASEAIASYLFLGYLPQDLTPIESVNKLLPGTLLRFSGEQRLQVQTYWRLDKYLSQERSCDDLREELSYALNRSFALRLERDEQVGYLATGDLPSALTGQALRAQTDPSRIFAMAVEYPGQNDQEIQAATHLCSQFGAQPRTASVTPETLLDDLISVVWHLDEPIAHPASIGIWRLSQLAKRLGISLYTDLGAEEVLLGPPEEALSPPADPRSSRLGTHLLFPLVRPFSSRAAFSLLRRANYDPWLTDYAAKHALFPHESLRALSPSLSRHFDPDIFLQRMFQQSELGAGRNAHLYLEARTILTDEDILVFERLGTAAGLTCRAPFLDHRLVELIASLSDPCRQAIGRDDFQMLRTLSNLPPVETVAPYRKAGHFLNAWIHDGAIQRSFRYLLSGSLVESGWVSRDWISNALSGRLSPPASFQQLWSLLTLEVWHRLYVNRPITPPTMSLIDLLR